MKTVLVFLLSLSFFGNLFAQDTNIISKERLINDYAEEACKCIDSIATFNLSKNDTSERIKQCIDKQTVTYQLSRKLFNVMQLSTTDSTATTEKKNLNVNIDMNDSSKEYKKYYYEIERHLMENCAAIKNKVATNDKVKEHSLSDIPEAIKWFSKGVEEIQQGNSKKAAKYYKKAVKADPDFVFAWDNLGLSYRKLKKYDNAIEAYEKSLSIDPEGTTPLQNLAVVYTYKEEFDKAISTYKRLAKVSDDNPEVFYGLGSIYFNYKKDNENGLQNLCKAYNIYVAQNSPYRTDAENLISHIYSLMKKEGNEKRFYEILKENNINSSEED